jgi:UrcA family protein
MHTILRKRLYTGLSCLLGTLAASGAMSSPAGAHEETPISKVVRFGDLDLTTLAGAQVLYRRIQAAAEEVCALPIPGSLVTREEERACMRTAIDKAVRRVDSAQLTALRFGSPVLMARK